jgi:hypothetical protein
MSGLHFVSAVGILATAAIPAAEFAMSPEQIEAIGSWRLHVVLGAVAVISMLLASRMSRYAIARVEHITKTQADALSHLTEAIHMAALANQRLAQQVASSPCLVARMSAEAPLAPPVQQAFDRAKRSPLP